MLLTWIGLSPMLLPASPISRGSEGTRLPRSAGGFRTDATKAARATMRRPT
jgi:hypothetical protein